MKISEILYTVDRNLIQPDINKMIDKYHSRAKKENQKWVIIPCWLILLG